MENISFAVAFSAGLLSFLSPCILPLIPAYLSYISGNAVSEIIAGDHKKDLMLKALGFVLGFSFVFVVMGASASSLGRLFAAHQATLTKIGGVFIILMGIHMTGLIKIKWLYQEKRLVSFSEKNRGLGSFFVGMAFATGWTPCIGPILSSILIYASSMETISSGILLLISYSLGVSPTFLIYRFCYRIFYPVFQKVLQTSWVDIYFKRGFAYTYRDLDFNQSISLSGRLFELTQEGNSHEENTRLVRYSFPNHRRGSGLQSIRSADRRTTSKSKSDSRR
jgi:cytochrome c-type biogenesis protein